MGEKKSHHRMDNRVTLVIPVVDEVVVVVGFFGQ